MNKISKKLRIELYKKNRKSFNIKNLPKKEILYVSSKILSQKYSNREIQIIILEITNNLIKKLNLNKIKTNCIRLYIGYENEEIPSIKMTLHLVEATNSYSKIIKTLIKNYNKNITSGIPVKKIGISFVTQ